jgi:hypothetical protein
MEQLAILLRNGKVLVAGGQGADYGHLASAELFDPANGTWTPTGSMKHARVNPAATLLPLDGKVFVVGGYDNLKTNGMVLPPGHPNLAGLYLPVRAELYDPATGQWVETDELNTIRRPESATLLPNGKVLVTGDDGTGDGTTIAEIYDPASGTWTQTSSMTGGFTPTTTPLLFNGHVMIFGEFPHDNPHNAEIYNPDDGTWSAITNAARLFTTPGHTMTLLSNGKVLFVAKPQSGYAVFTASCIEHNDFSGVQLYDLAGGTSADGAPMAEPRSDHTATLLLDGRVLVLGGQGRVPGGDPLRAELYDPTSDRWTQIPGHLATRRRDYTATLLPNGKVLIAGGMPGLSSTELYDPGETSPLH